MGSSVRVEVKNVSQRPVLLGDAVALRGRPKDDCVGPGPAAVRASQPLPRKEVRNPFHAAPAPALAWTAAT